VAAFAAYAADRYDWRTWQIGTIATISLVVSRVWFPINQGVIEGAPPLEYPAQFYFMNFGPWMSNSAYWVFMAGLGVVVAVVALLIRQAPRISRPG
jgi:hypothetical protein